MGPARASVHAVGLILAAGLVAACNRSGGDDEPERPVLRMASEVVAGGEDLAIADRHARYTAEYRVQTVDDDRVRVGSERVVVSRPWNSRLEQFSGRSFDGEVTSSEIASFGRRRIGAGEGLVIALPPALAAADVRFAALEDASALDLVEPREVRRLDGRECQVLRSAEGLFASALTPLADGADDRVDTCVTAEGVTVEEALVQGGRIVRLRTLIRYEPAAEDVFEIDDAPVSPRDGGGSIQRLTPDSAYPGGHVVPERVPEGFAHRGRYAVVPPQSENFTNPTREAHIVAGVADVYERGMDALVVDQGGTLRGADPFPAPPDGARTVELPALGRAELLVSLRMSELRVLRPGGRYVRVYGTLSLAELESFARSLREGPGGQLTPDPAGGL